MADAIKLQIEIDGVQHDQLKDLMKRCGIRTKKEFFNNAFTLFSWCVSEKEKGRSVGSHDSTDKTFREVLLPVLERASAVAALLDAAEKTENGHEVIGSK